MTTARPSSGTLNAVSSSGVELDAAFFHLYGISRDDTAYILDTFPVLKQSEKREYGEYRTKRVVLETYDALAAAVAKGITYESPLGPPRRAT